MSTKLTPSKSTVDLQRRGFIRNSITGGVVAALSTAHPVLAGQTDNSCGPISKSDWLVNGLALVTEVSINAYSKIVAVTTEALTTYQSAFDELYCLLNALQVELVKSSPTARVVVERMQTLTEVGRTNTGLVNVALREREVTSRLFVTLAMVSQEICAQVKNIAPAETEWRLSREAAGILKKILELVTSEKFVNLHNGVREAQTTTSTESEKVNTQISKLQLAITTARSAAILAENPHPPQKVDQKEQRRIYDQQLVNALEALKTLTLAKQVDSFLPNAFLQELPDSVMSPEKVKQAVEQAASTAGDAGFSAADALILGLGNCRREGIMSAMSTADVRFVAAAYYSTPPSIDRNAMANLLWSYCPPGSRDQIDKVDSVVAFVGGWNSWIPVVARIALIGSALFWANKLQRVSCSAPKDLRSLAQGLANLA